MKRFFIFVRFLKLRRYIFTARSVSASGGEVGSLVAGVRIPDPVIGVRDQIITKKEERQRM